ncbi:tetratricopeptide repeat protein [Gluconobacter sp. P5B12]|uniref:tetratricopeptide repeat protein n=1 Tax=Gluconobacter sp. P5B12 TaxID=2762618 RepID=UPI001C03BF6C
MLSFIDISFVYISRFLRKHPTWRRMLFLRVMKFGAYLGVDSCNIEIGSIYLNNCAFSWSRYDAAFWFYKSSLRGNKGSQYILGTLLCSGLPVGSLSLEYNPNFFSRDNTPNLPEGIKWLRYAAEQGHAAAAGKLGDLLLNGPPEIRSPVEGVQFLLAAAKQNIPAAQLSLGQWWVTNAVDDAMRRVAASYVSLAADNGHPPAIYIKGIMLERGFGLLQDKAESVRCFQISSASNIPASQRKYAIELLKGKIVKRNAFKAETLLRKSARAGDYESAELLAYLYETGLAFHRSSTEASIWRTVALSNRQALSFT